ncbi:HEAT repeat domain-containing protein [Blastopirellula sp. JC732]|uniref:HEAT repeat domain-containing protein n=1 Tax=Blastopirellula sediminis TaxID=2894196 RepID=A0A9X1MJ59_9BACT|nr:HEAT repeat domain-containing protein [Blastopirellula sediminis]MCC9607932.1 HEAT repeat domain-containing protein [Blastopirellula sediminis]MCC9627275.1 HEAT repeat domain-containing protein [Blastopirellula sediminis]
MDRRLALLVALLLPGCTGPTDTAQSEQTPVRVGQAEQEKQVMENPIDTSEFSLDEGSSDRAEMPTEENAQETAMPAAGKLPPLVVEGAPVPPEPFSGQENAPGTPIPEAVQRTLSSYSDESFDALVKLILTYPQAEVRAKACEKLDGMYDSRSAEALLTARAAVRDPDPSVRAAAVGAIRWGFEQDGWKAGEALGELVTVIQEEDAANAVLSTLQELGPAAAPTVPYLMALLDDPAVENKNDIVIALGAIGEPAKLAIAKIAAFAKESESNYAGRALGMLGAEKELLALLGDSTYGVRQTAYEGIRLLKDPHPPTVKAVLKGTTDETEWYERSTAAETLGAIRPSTPEIVDALVRLADDEQVFVRTAAYKSLAEIDPGDDRVVPILVRAIDKEDAQQKYEIQQALSKAKGSPEIRLQALLHLQLQNQDAFLGSLSQGGKEFYPLLKKIVADKTKSDQERAVALTTLGEMRDSLERNGKEVKEEIRAFAQGFTGSDQPAVLRGAAGVVMDDCGADDDETNDLILLAIQTDGLLETRKRAISTMGWREYAPALPTLIKILESQDEKLQRSTLEALGNYEEAAADAVPAIVALEFDPDDDQYDEQISVQARTLGAIGAHPELSRPLLEKLLAETKPEEYAYDTILLALCQVIAANDLDATAVLPPILSMLKNSEQQYERNPAFEMLTQLGPKGASTTELMIQYLESNYSSDREKAVEALESFGPAAKEAGPALAAAAGSWRDARQPLAALAAIKAGGPELAAVVPKLLQNVDERRHVLETLAAIGPSAGDAVPAVAEVLDSPDNWERKSAIEALAGMKEASKSAIPKLRELALNDPRSDVREAAGQALLQIAPDDPEVAEVAFAQLDLYDDEAVDKLLDDLGDGAAAYMIERTKSKEPSVRKNGLLLLSRTTIPRDEAVAIYRERLNDDDREVKGAAAAGMLKLGERTVEVANALVSTLSGEADDWEIQDKLYHLRQARPALVAVVLDKEKTPQLRHAAADLLIDPFDSADDPELRPLYEALAGDDASQQMWAALTLAGLSDHSAAVLKPLIAATKEEGTLGASAIRRLGGFLDADNEQRDKAEAALVELVAAEDEEVAETAVFALNDELTDASLAKITAMLKEERTKLPATRVLVSSSRSYELDAEMRQSLTAMFASYDDDVVERAVMVLAASGPSGVEAVVDVVADEESELSTETKGMMLLFIAHTYRSQRALKLNNETFLKLRKLITAEPQRLATSAAVVLAEGDVKDLLLGPALLHGFDWDEYLIQTYSLKSLRRRSWEADAVVPELIKRMPTETNDVRRFFFAQVLETLGKDDPAANDAVIDAITSVAENLRYQITRELSDATRERLAARLSEFDDPEKKSRALWGYYQSLYYQEVTAGPQAPAMLYEAVRSDDPEINLPAALALAQLDPQASDAVEPLMAELEAGPRADVCQGLRRLKDVAGPAVPRLIELLKVSDVFQSNAIAQVLGEIGPAAAPAVDELEKRVADERFRYPAIEALKGIGPAANRAAPAIIAQIRGSESLTPIAEALIAIGGPTDALIAEYQRRLADRYERYDVLADLPAIAAIKPIAPDLLSALNSDDSQLQIAAAKVIMRLEKQDPTYLAPLLTHVDAKNPKVSEAMIQAVAQQTDAAEKVLPVLSQKLTSPDKNVRAAAAAGIGSFKEKGKVLVPTLVPLVRDDSFGTSVIDSVGDIGPAAAPAVPELQKALIDLLQSDSNVAWRLWARHWGAIVALGKIGPASKPALPKLLELYGTAEEEWDKERLGEAIWKIDSEAAKQAGIEPPKEKEEE